MRHRNPARNWLAAGLVVSVVLAGTQVVKPPPAAADLPPDNPCVTGAGDVNHASIRLDGPPNGTRLTVDEQGKITVQGVLHKQASMVDVSVESVTTSQFTIGPPPESVSAWAASWTATLRPAHLGASQVCVRAEREPRRVARIMRSVTVVDLIPPSRVPDLAVTALTSTSAKVTWGTATDNFGLAGYEVSVDGGNAVRTMVGTHSYTITGLSPATDHTVSVVAVDLAGNTSTTPATVSFTTPATPPHNDAAVDAHEGFAVFTFQPDLAADVTYRAFLDGASLEDFPLDLYCRDANGNPASPCTEQDVIRYEIADLDEGTPYQLQVQGLAADGTPSRVLSATFTTLTSPRVVPEATVALIASESSQCAGRGGSFYVSPSQRGRVPIPTGSTQLFGGCYVVPDHSCIDRFLPPSGDKQIDCEDDVTRLLRAVAPAGHGPVISSMDGLGAPSAALATDPGTLFVETIAWCEEDLACTVVLDAAVEVAAAAAVTAVAEATISWIVVLAAGIVLGLTLFALYELLFPSPTAIGSFIEYPIHFNTNFDTFDNWGQGKGHWVGTLKTYAEVIKTTTQVAAQRNISFAWNPADDDDLKRVIDRACGVVAGRPPAVGNVCPDNLTVYVPGANNYLFDPMPQTGAHIVDALSFAEQSKDPRRTQWYYPAYSKGGAKASGPPNFYSRRWYERAAFKPNVCENRGTNGCDEFPFWTTNQAVNLSGPLADIRQVPGEENSIQGTDTSGFYSQCEVNDGDHFIVLPVKPWVDAGGPSFGFRVNQGGASLCMPPRVR